jgi:hypothetical protein
MLTLTGVIRAVTTLGGGVNKKTGEVIPTRPVLQVEGLDNRGLVQLFTLTVPDTKPFEGKVGEQVTVPVRAWAPGAQVSLAYEGARCEWGTQQAAACGRWQDAGRHTQAAAGGGSRVHTYKQLLQPNIHAGLRPVEGCCVFIETQEPSRLKSHVPARFRTLQLQLRGV